MWPFISKYDLYDGKIRIGSSDVKVRIFFDKKTHNQIAEIINKTIAGGYKNFQDRFDKLIFPLIKYVFQNDRYLRSSPDLKKIELRFFPEENETAGHLHLSESTACYVFLSLGLELMLRQIKEFEKKGKMNSRRFMKFVEHEIFHFFDRNVVRESWDVFDKENEKYIDLGLEAVGKFDFKIIKKLSLYRPSQFYAFVVKIRTEGIAKFREAENTEKIEINTDFNVTLKKLFNNSFSGEIDLFSREKGLLMQKSPYFRAEYRVGRFMCLIIAIYFLKKKKRTDEVFLQVGSEQWPIENIGSFFSKYPKFYVTKIPRDVFFSTLNIVSKLNADKFINVFNKACNDLGISHEHRIVNWEDYIKIKNNIKKANNFISDQLKEKGFKI